jgi:DNA-binding transcriptional LysR family regulator
VIAVYSVSLLYRPVKPSSLGGEFMQGRQSNIPIEILRTIVAISEASSYSKAALRLGLSQPAVSAQVKRIEGLVGGALFTRASGGHTTTDLGKLILNKARVALEANDQMLRLGGPADGPQPLRIGLSTLLVRPFIKLQTASSLERTHILSDHSAIIAQGFLDGYIDLACIFENSAIDPAIQDYIVAEYDETLVWVRSPGFTPEPGVALPILTWPGDEWMVPALKRAGLAFRIALNSPDYHAKEAAVEAGFGLTAIPRRLIPSTLVWANEPYLPVLPPFKAFIAIRDGSAPAVKAAYAQLKLMFP